MHRHRLLSAIVVLPFLLFLILAGSPVHFFLVVSGVTLVGLLEFYRMAAVQGLRPLTGLGLVGGGGLSVVLFRGGGSEGVALLLTAFLVVILLRLLLTGSDPSGALLRGAITLWGALYVGLLLSFPVLLRQMPGGEIYVLYLLLVTWGGDTGAFYVGRRWGRHTPWPMISPNKSLEGAAGALAGSLLGSVLAKVWFWPTLSWPSAAVLGLLLALLGVAGDLAESLLKRSLKAKDAGTIIPGHGGVLDRVDSLLFTGPVLYICVVYRWVG